MTYSKKEKGCLILFNLAFSALKWLQNPFVKAQFLTPGEQYSVELSLENADLDVLANVFCEIP